MSYEITITHDADAQLRALPARAQRIIESAIITRLTEQPTVETKAIQRLRPNPFAQFELRVGDYRVLYNIVEETSEIAIVAIGQKVGNALIVGGQEFHAHRSDPPEPTPNGHAGTAQ
ncbi:MAG: type II toxin-antitoxin system RelE/ParE family toxin [Planctomycetia bacterium]|nr:type II toxin-antitoxin system RelE/ParE family toxin [Planctomycetia bacterium]